LAIVVPDPSRVLVFEIVTEHGHPRVTTIHELECLGTEFRSTALEFCLGDHQNTSRPWMSTVQR